MSIPRDSTPPWDNYDARSRPVDKRRLEWLFTDLPPHAHVLDVGANNGGWARAMGELRPDITIDVLDNRAGEFREQYNTIPQITAVLDQPVQELKGANLYDAVWARGTLFFVPQNELQQTLNAIKTALKPGGVLEFTYVESLNGHNFLFHPLPREALVDMVRQAGLELVSVDTDEEARYGQSRTPLPTCIIRARKP